jgi:hypothetical protein
MVAVAVGMFWMARYAAQNPASFYSRWLSATRIGLNVMCPGATQVAFPEGSAETVTMRDHACVHAQPVCEIQSQPCPRKSRVPKPTAKVEAQEPVEVIKIEQIDPAFAKAVAEILEVQHIVHPQQAPSPCPARVTDELVLTILDPDGPVQLNNPDKSETIPQAPSCPQTVSGWMQIRMPYCADSGEFPTSCPASQNDHGSIFEILFGAEPLVPVKVSVGETTDLVMPYAEDDEEDASESQETEMPVANPESEVVPMSRETNTRPTMDPTYHHEYEGCPYLNGNYCPRYSREYAPPAAQPQETQPQQEQPMETEEQERP